MFWKSWSYAAEAEAGPFLCGPGLTLSETRLGYSSSSLFERRRQQTTDPDGDRARLSRCRRRDYNRDALKVGSCLTDGQHFLSLGGASSEAGFIEPDVLQGWMLAPMIIIVDTLTLHTHAPWHTHSSHTHADTLTLHTHAPWHTHSSHTRTLAHSLFTHTLAHSLFIHTRWHTHSSHTRPGTLTLHTHSSHTRPGTLTLHTHMLKHSLFIHTRADTLTLHTHAPWHTHSSHTRPGTLTLHTHALTHSLFTHTRPGTLTYPAPSPSQLGSLLWHRYHALKQHLEQHLSASLPPRGLTLCAERWRSLGAGGGGGRLYLTVSAHFVDRDWRLARCVLETRPVPELAEGAPETQLGVALRSVLSEFRLPESAVSCVVHDRCRVPEEQEERQGREALPAGWAALCCAGEALKLCVQEGLSTEPVRQALAAARAIVSHFQHDARAAAALNPKAGARLVLDEPGRWATALEMCESLLELKWVVSSVLEEQKAPPNLADHQWRLLQELAPVLRTVRIAAAFLSEDANAAVSALMPCLHGVTRLLGQRMAESGCAAAQGVMGRVRAQMERRWQLGEEEALLGSPAVLASFLDPRFKELRFLSPDARSKLHNRGEERELGRTSPEPQSMYDLLLGEDPTERMPEIHQQLENYIAEPLCKRSLSPLDWWRAKEHRFPAVARLARQYLAIPATAPPADRAFAPRETPAAQRRATLGPQHLDHILFLHQNCDYLERLRGGAAGRREPAVSSTLAARAAANPQARESLYQSLVSYENRAWLAGEEP
ncbi:ZBED1 protein, partial [Atractosteus spatula]|nr:ZBED1 protein [Atractosteus spatula]